MYDLSHEVLRCLFENTFDTKSYVRQRTDLTYLLKLWNLRHPLRLIMQIWGKCSYPEKYVK